MNDLFDKDMKLSERRQPDAERIYRSILPVDQILRFPHGTSLHHLDRYFAIDVLIILKDGMIVTIQEKFRDHEVYLQWRDFTVELLSNKYGTPGEWSKLCTDLYCYGWENENQDGFAGLRIFYVMPVKRAIAEGRLRGRLCENKKHSTAPFCAFPFAKFDQRWVLYRFDTGAGTEEEALGRAKRLAGKNGWLANNPIIRDRVLPATLKFWGQPNSKQRKRG